MELNKDEKTILNVLLEKELKDLKEDAGKLLISNSPFLNKVVRDEADLPFLKSAELYKKFLMQFKKKL